MGFIPGGDIAKAAVKGATKATKAAAKAAKAGAKAADNVGKVVKGSTAAAADGLSGAQKGAGKVNAPRGPPTSVSNANHGHHADPKFMGGDPKQKLTKMPDKLHEQLHKDLNAFLRQRLDAAGNHMRPQRGNSGKKIQERFSAEARRRAMADFYRQYGSKYPLSTSGVAAKLERGLGGEVQNRSDIS